MRTIKSHQLVNIYHRHHHRLLLPPTIEQIQVVVVRAVVAEGKGKSIMQPFLADL